MGGVDGGVRNVTEKGLVLVLVDEVDRGIGHGIGDQWATGLFPLIQGRGGNFRFGFPLTHMSLE